MFRITPRDLAVVKECLTRRVAKEMTNAAPEMKAREVERRYAAAVTTAGRMVGQQLDLCGFPDWVNHMKSDLDPDLPGIHMQGCCADATLRASHAIWSETVTGNERETRVNLAFNRDSPLVRVVSCLPHRGELNVFVKNARRVLVRVPGWAPQAEVKTFVGKKAARLMFRYEIRLTHGVRNGLIIEKSIPQDQGSPDSGAFKWSKLQSIKFLSIDSPHSRLLPQLAHRARALLSGQEGSQAPEASRAHIFDVLPREKQSWPRCRFSPKLVLGARGGEPGCADLLGLGCGLGATPVRPRYCSHTEISLSWLPRS